MKVNLLAVSIGNTRTRVGAIVDGELERSVSVSSDDAAALREAMAAAVELLPVEPGTVALVASVDPKQTQSVMRVIREQHKLPAYRVESDVPVPIGRQLDPETIVGEDRLLNAAAAYSTVRQACIIVDAGTALTVDFVDGAGTFHGGAIAPGARMMLDALHDQTAQLPEVTVSRPAEAIGHNTVEAMRSAMFHGMRGMVRELVEQFAETAGQYPLVIATGGDAEMLFADYELIERIVPDLTLLGMAATYAAAARADAGESE